MNGPPRLVWFLGVLLLLASAVRSAPEDKPADFLIDISSTCEKPLGILIKTKKNLWQLPTEQVRQGYGLSFFSIAHHTTNNCEARILVEVEPMQGRTLVKAVEEAVGNLEGVLEGAQIRLVGKVKKGKRTAFKIGKTKLFGIKLRYAVQVRNKLPRTTDQVTALAFEHEGAFVTVTIENYSTITDHFSPFLDSMSIVKLPVRKPPARIKLVDATRGIYRYISVPLPKNMVPSQAGCPAMVAARFVRYDKKTGKPLARLMVAKSDVRGRWKFPRVVEIRRSNLLDMYEEVSALKEIQIGDRDGYLVTYVDNTEEAGPLPCHASKAYLKVLDQNWTWTYESWAQKPAQLKKDNAEFRKFLAAVNLWIAKQP